MRIPSMDRIGSKFEKLTIVDVWREGGVTYCKALCDCGNYKVSALNTVVRNNVKSCGCLPRPTKDITGIHKGRATAISITSNKSNNGDFIWNFKCDCGNDFTATIGGFMSGHTASCGCLLGDIIRLRESSHGMVNTNAYTSWRKMRERCYSPKDILYPKYGGAGITICDSWYNSFQQFYKDMGVCEKGMTIDRIDLSLGYFPENCRWSSKYVQNRNKGSYTGTSKYKGVMYEESSGKWVASFSVGSIKGKKIGRYLNEDNAAKAYNLASEMIFGKGNTFLHLNDVDDDYSNVNTDCKFFNYWVYEMIKEKEKLYEINPTEENL